MAKDTLVWSLELQERGARQEMRADQEKEESCPTPGEDRSRA